MDNIKIQLRHAKKLYDSKKYEEALNLYEELFNENSKEFDMNSKISYCWAIYKVQVKNFTDIDELYDSVEFICDLIPQADLNSVNTCPYTFSVFKVLDYLYNKKEYYNLFDWFDKLDPKLLDENRSNFKGRLYRSRKEKYYDYLSKSNLECADWDLCIEISKEALTIFETFINHGDTWHRWRIAKSLKELHQNNEALIYLEEVLKVKKEWFVYKEIAENYYILNDNKKALEYIPGAILTDDSIKMKVNLYYFIYDLLKDLDYNMAIKHAQLYYLIKSENNSEISADIENLNFDKNELNKVELVDEINKYWESFKLTNQEFQKYFKKRESFNQISIRGE